MADNTQPKAQGVSRREFLVRAGRLAGGTAALAAVPSLLAACGSGNGTGAATASTGDGSSIANSSAAPSLSTGKLIDVKGVRSSATSWLWAPVDVAESQGFFKKEGLNYTHVATGNGENAPVVLGGGADILLSTPTSALKADMKGQSLPVFAIIVTTYASNIVMSAAAWQKSGLTDSASLEERAKAMKGHRWGTTGPGAAPDLLFRYILRNIAKLDPNKDATLVPVQGGDGGLLAALKNGQIDGFCLSSPTSDQAVTQLGAHYLFNMAENPIPQLVSYPYISISARKDYIDKNGEVIERYCRALVDAINFIKSDKDGFKTYEREHFKTLDDATFATAFKQNYPIYADSIVPTEKQFDQNKVFLLLALEAQHADAAAAKKLTFANTFAPSFAQRAEQSK